MEPAEHAATVREARRIAGQQRDNSGSVWDVLAYQTLLVCDVADALAERATELERRLTDAKKLAREWEYDCRVARERAEQLESELATATTTMEFAIRRCEQLEKALRLCVTAIEDAYGGDPVPEDGLEGEALDAARDALDGGTAT